MEAIPKFPLVKAKQEGGREGVPPPKEKVEEKEEEKGEKEGRERRGEAFCPPLILAGGLSLSLSFSLSFSFSFSSSLGGMGVEEVREGAGEGVGLGERGEGRGRNIGAEVGRSEREAEEEEEVGGAGVRLKITVVGDLERKEGERGEEEEAITFTSVVGGKSEEEEGGGAGCIAEPELRERGGVREEGRGGREGGKGEEEWVVAVVEERMASELQRVRTIEDKDASSSLSSLVGEEEKQYSVIALSLSSSLSFFPNPFLTPLKLFSSFSSLFSSLLS